MQAVGVGAAGRRAGEGARGREGGGQRPVAKRSQGEVPLAGETLVETREMAGVSESELGRGENGDGPFGVVGRAL
jgi:hypothetical protein